MKLYSIFYISVFILFPIFALSQTYEDWDDHDVTRFYEKIDLPSDALDKEGESIDEVYVPTTVEDGTYEIEVYKVSSKLYQIRETNIYMYFTFTPFLFSFDKGILKVSYNSGTFYEEP
jgi:hypothetical protein